ncbi:MAG TPA: DUF2752 domain-containing protein [Acidimicrobiia bacterium]|nr:DUF2752 domain-containing protein [Acidimicrobiia bacterium]
MTRAWRDKLLFAAPLAVIGLLAAIRPGDDGVIICPFALITGMACPGCGMTRAASYLVRGDVSTALGYHPLVPFIAVLVVGGWAWYLLRRSGRVPPLPTRWVNTIFIVTGVMLLGVWGARLLSGTLPPV